MTIGPGCPWQAQAPGTLALVTPTPPPAVPPPPPHPQCVQVAALGPRDVLPPDLMHRFYHDCYALLRSGRYVDRIAPFLKHFKREK